MSNNNEPKLLGTVAKKTVAGGMNFSEDVTLVTCTSNQRDVRLQMLLNRATSLGYKTQWLDCSDAFARQPNALWGLRMKKYQNFVDGLAGDPLLVFVDGLDIIVEGSAAEAGSRFTELGTSMVFSCVSYKWPRNCAAYKNNHSAASNSCSYPCGGAYMGRASGFRTLFGKGGSFSAETDDQCWLYSALYEYMKVGHGWKLDSQARLFLSYTRRAAWDFPYSLEGGRHVFNVPSLESHPTFVHLDTAHPSAREMAKLQSCLPGSQEPQCSKVLGGRWPDPHGQQNIELFVRSLGVLVLVLGMAMGTCHHIRQRRCSK